jgi:hypothetical protein
MPYKLSLAPSGCHVVWGESGGSHRLAVAALRGRVVILPPDSGGLGREMPVLAL